MLTKSFVLSGKIGEGHAAVVERSNTGVGNNWLDFCLDIGPKKLVTVLLATLLASLYVACIATDFAKTYDTRIPIETDHVHQEL